MNVLQKNILSVAVLSFWSAMAGSSAVAADPNALRLQCRMMPAIVQAFLRSHVSYKNFDDEIEKRAIEQWIGKLDPSKSAFLESDIQKIRADLKGISKKLGTDCSALDNSQKILIERLNENYEYVKKILGSDSYKIAENTELVIDPKKRKWAASKSDLESMTRKLVDFQISNYLATEIKLPEAKKQLIHRYELAAQRQKKLAQDELFEIFLDAFASGLDAHSGYLGRDSLEDFEIQMRLSLEGIGASLSWEDGYTVVNALIPGGAADRSGEVQPNDKIIGVAQGESAFENVIDMPLRDVVKLIRGKKDTWVRLSILRQKSGETERLIIKLKRDKVKLEDEAARLVYIDKKVGAKTHKIAVIELPSFYGDLNKGDRSCFMDIKKLVEKAAAEKADGIVFDMSKNGGGLLTEAVKIGGLFMKTGNVVATQDFQSHIETLADKDDTVQWKGPVVVLTSRLSASASEIVTGALKDYGRAVVVGNDRTFGKGSVQAMINLPGSLGAVKVTTGMFFIPKGDSTQYKGVTSDIEIPGPFMQSDMSESALDYSLPPKSIPGFVSSEAGLGEVWKPVSADHVNQLKKLSKSRVEKDPEFEKIRKELAEQEKKKGVMSIAEATAKQNERAKEGKDKKSAKNKAKKDKEEYLNQPSLKEAVNVMADYLTLLSGGQPVAANSTGTSEKGAN